MERSKGLTHLTVAWLAAVAIAGLLSMHGLDLAALQPALVESHGAHNLGTTGDSLHAAMGICVFAIATSLGLALATSTAQLRGPQILPRWRAANATTSPVSAASGRQRLADLCVLRL